jgi:hypothetical protein
MKPTVADTTIIIPEEPNIKAKVKIKMKAIK